MRRTLVSASLLAATLLGICLSDLRPAAAQSWPMYQANPSHTGYMPVSLDPGQFYVRWSKGIGVSAGGPYSVNPVAAGDGRVYATLSVGNVTQLFGLGTTDGSTLWSKGFGDVFSVNPPAYVNGIVYLQTCNHTPDTWLWAFDGGSGANRFRAPLTAQWESYYAPTVFSGGVYVDGGYYGGIYGFNGSSGSQAWFTQLSQYDAWTPAVGGSHAYAYLGDSPGYAAGLYVLKLLDGTPEKLVGFIPDPDFEWDGWSMDQAPVLGGAGEVLAINRGVFKPGRLIAFNPSNGTIAWQLKDKYTGQPSVAAGRIYVVNNGGLSVLDEGSHTLLWSWMPPQPLAYARAITQPMIVTDTHVLVSTQDTVYAIDLATHAALWSFAAPNAKLAIADGTLFVAGGDGFLTAIALTSNVKATSINPNTGPSIGGTPVTIAGSGFQAGATVTFGGNAATVTSVTSSQIQATTPPHVPGPVDVAVINPDREEGHLWGGFTYTPCGAAAPTAVVSGTAAICSGSSTDLSVALTGTGPWTLYWSDGFIQSGVGASPATRTVSPSATTAYAVATVADANCANTAAGSATVTVNTIPSATITAPAALCQGAPGVVAAVPDAGAGATYAWTITNGTITNGAGTRAITFAAGTASPLRLDVSVTRNGCGAASSVNIPVTPVATAAVTGSAAICANSSTTIQAALTGVAPWTVRWSDGVTQSGVAASPATRIVTPTASTTYSVTSVSDATGCTGTSSGLADVIVKPAPPALITPGAAQVCPGSTGNVASTPDAGPGAAYGWTIANGTITSGAGTRQIAFTAGASGNVTLTVTTTAPNGCSTTDTRTWTILPTPAAVLSGPASACAGQPTTLVVNLTGQPPWNLKWSDGLVQFVPANPATRVVTLAADTAFSLASVTDGGGCVGAVSGNVSVAVHQLATAAVSGAATVCSQGAATISAVVNAAGPFSVRWNDGVVQSGTGSTTLTRVVRPVGTTLFKIDSIFDGTCTSPGSGGALVKVGLEPGAARVTAPGAACAGATGLVASVPDAGAGGEYAWTVLNGTLVAGQGTRSVVFTAGASGPVHLAAVVKVGSGCQVTGTWDVIVNRTPDAPLITAPARAVSGDAGLAASVPAAGSDAFEWSVENGTLTSGQGTDRISFTAGLPGVTTLRVVQKAASGCPSEAAVLSIPVSGYSASRIVPVVVSVAGSAGAQFTSELTLANPGGAPAHADLTLTPAESLGGGAPTTVGQDIGPGQQIVIPDAFALFGHPSAARGTLGTGTGGGSVRVSFSNLPARALVYGGARTTTPSGAGRAGLAYPALAPEELFVSPVAIYGLRETAAERTNLALENMGTSGAIALKVTVVSGAGNARVPLADPVILPPGQWVQIGSVLKTAGFESGWVLVERVSGTDPFYAYAVTNDNVTNDGTFLAAVPSVRPPTAQVVPSIVETALFHSELVLVNPGAAPTTATLNFIESLASPHGNSTGFVTVSLAPGEQKFIPDVVDYLRSRGASPGPKGAAYAGPLFVRFGSAGAAVDGYAASRTSTPMAGGGGYGVSYEGVLPGRMASSSAWVFGLQQNASSRSNLALLNASTSLGPISLRYDVYDGTGGTVAGSVSVSLQPGQWTQVNSILKGFGLSNGYVKVTRTSGAASWVAYGVVNDGPEPGAGTGDGSFLAMTLAP